MKKKFAFVTIFIRGIARRSRGLSSLSEDEFNVIDAVLVEMIDE